MRIAYRDQRRRSSRSSRVRCIQDGSKTHLGGGDLFRTGTARRYLEEFVRVDDCAFRAAYIYPRYRSISFFKSRCADSPRCAPSTRVFRFVERISLPAKIHYGASPKVYRWKRSRYRAARVSRCIYTGPRLRVDFPVWRTAATRRGHPPKRTGESR